ncbi:MAG: hypothetical protein QG652_1528 [Pseudomonadota bacterium]|nr:hypothetical protein [Pseudomonadota bacterium]
MKLSHGFAKVLLLLAVCATPALADISRAAFTSAIEGREPVDQLSQLGNDKTSVYFFTEITGLNGHTITHRWEFGGEPRFEISFSVGADRWRVWSNKTLAPEMTGEWKVVVLDEAGFILRTELLNYVAASAPAEPAPAAQ